MAEDLKADEARVRLLQTSFRLRAKFGPVEAAGMLLACGFAMMENEYGRDKALEYIRELALELETDTSEPVIGHA